jgi:hypothetical protein
MTATNKALTIPGLETVYDALANAIDQAGDKTTCSSSSWRCQRQRAGFERFQQHCKLRCWT